MMGIVGVRRTISVLQLGDAHADVSNMNQKVIDQIMHADQFISADQIKTGITGGRPAIAITGLYLFWCGLSRTTEELLESITREGFAPAELNELIYLEPYRAELKRYAPNITVLGPDSRFTDTQGNIKIPVLTAVFEPAFGVVWFKDAYSVPGMTLVFKLDT